MIAGTEAQQTAQFITLLVIAGALWLLWFSITKIQAHYRRQAWAQVALNLEPTPTPGHNVHYSRWIETNGWPCQIARIEAGKFGGIMHSAIPDAVTCSECLASPVLSRMRPQSGQDSALDDRPLDQQGNDHDQQHEGSSEYQNQHQVIGRHPLIVPKPRYRRAGA